MTTNRGMGTKHPRKAVLLELLRGLSVVDAGLLVHLLDCERCAGLARKVLAPKPMRRRRRALKPSGEARAS